MIDTERLMTRALIATDAAKSAEGQARAAGLKPDDLIQIMGTALIMTMLKHSKGADVLTALRELRTRTNQRIDRLMEVSLAEPDAARFLDMLRRMPAETA